MSSKSLQAMPNHASLLTEIWTVVMRDDVVKRDTNSRFGDKVLFIIVCQPPPAIGNRNKTNMDLHVLCPAQSANHSS
jgi:hypothetical protein